MKQDVEFTAGDLAEALKTKGSIAIHDIRALFTPPPRSRRNI